MLNLNGEVAPTNESLGAPEPSEQTRVPRKPKGPSSWQETGRARVEADTGRVPLQREQTPGNKWIEKALLTEFFNSFTN